MRTHTVSDPRHHIYDQGERPYVSEDCGKGSAQSRHCEKNVKGFTQLGNLKVRVPHKAKKIEAEGVGEGSPEPAGKFIVYTIEDLCTM